MPRATDIPAIVVESNEVITRTIRWASKVPARQVRLGRFRHLQMR